MPDHDWLRQKLEAIEAKVDTLLVAHASHQARADEHERRIARFEDRQEADTRRVGLLEQSRAWILGAAAAVAAAVSAVGKFLWGGGQ